jgi:hypothetical protein
MAMESLGNLRLFRRGDGQSLPESDGDDEKVYCTGGDVVGRSIRHETDTCGCDGSEGCRHPEV